MSVILLFFKFLLLISTTNKSTSIAPEKRRWDLYRRYYVFFIYKENIPCIIRVKRRNHRGRIKLRSRGLIEIGNFSHRHENFSFIFPFSSALCAPLYMRCSISSVSQENLNLLWLFILQPIFSITPSRYKGWAVTRPRID